MNRILSLICFSTILFSSINSFSQKIYRGIEADLQIKNSEQVVINEKNNSLQFVVMKNNSYIEEANHLNWLKSSILKSNSDYELNLYKKEKDDLGYTHYRYQEFYKGVKVEHGVYYVHVKDGRVTSVNGEFYPNISQKLASATPSISKDNALAKAKSLFLSQELNNYSDKHSTLTVLHNNNTPHLCYHFELSSYTPLKHSEIYVDAQTNKVVLEINKIHTTDVPGTLVTNYSGTKTVTIDQVSGSQYRLQQAGKNIYTKNCNNGSSPGVTTDFINSTTTWTAATAINKSVFDLHYGLEKSYDYYYSKFSRNSYDGIGTQIKGVAHYGSGFSNAFWDGTYMVFGDGDGTSYNPFSCTDIVGHELTHAVTESSAGLVYMNESGGLNESFSDIFGVAIDFYANPATANFLEGEQCSVTNTPFRNMTNPKATFQPNTYLGQYWIPSGGSDNGGVHTNSQVQNHWFYLLCQGGTGTNDNSISYNISGIGITDAEKIAYRNLTNYLTPNSTYNDARIYSIQSAIDLFGSCSNNVTQCANAWYAVGVGSGLFSNAVVADFTSNSNFSCSVPASISYINNSVNSTSYVWQFGDGTTSTATNPVHTYTSAGVYSVALKSIGTSSCNTIDSILKVNYLTVTSSGAPASACIPTQASSTMGYGITKVEFGSISKNSSDATEGYKDFTCTNQTTLTAGNPYLVKITTPGNYERVAVWIDYNNDGSLNSGNELVFNSLNPSNSISTHTLVVHTPTSAVLNTPLRMRVYDDYTTITGSCSSHYYGQTEDYTVRFLASSTAPVANFYSNTRVTSINGTVNFYDSTLNVPTNYRWEFQGGSPSTSLAQNPSVLYTAVGTYSVKLVATNAFGSDSITKIAFINVVNVFNMCAGTNSTSVSSGSIYDSGGPSGYYQNNENCQFLINPGCTGTVSISFSQFSLESCCDYFKVYNGINTAAPLLGTFNGTTMPPTLFANSGKMLITWQTDGSVTYDGFAATWTSTLSGTIPPVANFSVSTTTPPLNANVQFSDQTTNMPYQWLWQFDDGTTSVLQNPTKTFTLSGLRTITLTATNCNTTSIVTKTVMVQGPATISVTPNPINALASCGGSVAVTVTITNTGSGDLQYSISNQSSINNTNLLLLTGYSGANETSNVNSILSSIPNCTVTNHTLTNVTNFQNALVGKNVLLIPELQNISFGVISTYSNSILNFANNGGLVITCGNTYNTNNEIGLFSASNISTSSSGNMNVLDTTDLITKTLPLIINAQNATFYATYTNTIGVVDLVKYLGYSVVSKKNIGTGKAIYIGYDYYAMDANSSKILSNAIKSNVSSASWLNTTPTSGTVTPAGTSTISLQFNTTNLAAGVYTTNVIINSNDLATPSYSLPVSYTVTGAASSSLSASCIDFGAHMQYVVKTDSVTLFNAGCSTLSVTSLNTSNSVFTYTPSTSFTIAAFGNKKIYITFSPTTIGVINDTLSIITNGGDQAICLSSTVTSAPSISVSPNNYSVNISACNSIATGSFNVYNVGGSNLTYSISGSTSTGSINVLAITNYVDMTQEYINTINSINAYYTGSNIVQHSLTSVSALQTALIGKQVILLPEQETYPSGFLQTYSVAINNFISAGGTAIICGNYDYYAHIDLGIFYTTNVANISSGAAIIDTNDVIMRGLPMGSIASPNATYAALLSDPSIINFVKSGSYSIVCKKLIGSGQAIFIASDFYTIDNNFSKIISNSIKYSGSVLPSWLTISNTTQTVTPGSSSIVTFTLNSGSLSAGTYTTNLLVTSNDPLTPTYTVPITMVVSNNPCANFAFTNSNDCTGIVTFTNNTVNTTTSYSWDFGNGITSTLTHPTVTYAVAGTYSVSLTACNGTMCSTYTETLAISGVGGPISNSCTPTSFMYGSYYGILNVNLNTINKTSGFSNPEGYQDFSCNNQTTLTLGTTYTLNVTTSSSYYENVSVWIDFDNNGAFTSTEQILNSLNKLTTHTLSFNPPATAVLNTPLRMRVIDEYTGYTIYTPCYNSYYGQAEDYTIKIQPNNVPPVAGFNSQINSCQGTINFTDNSLNNPTSWLWNFGDGNASSSQNTSHTYSTAGTYTVLLIASNAFGSNYTSQVITVNPLTFNIGVNGLMGVGQLLTYTTNLNGGLAYTWDFGDGVLSGNQTTTHTYTTAGIYSIQLTIISGACVNTVTTSLVIVSDVGLTEIGKELFGFNVFPNPFNSQTTINLKLYEDVELNIELLNTLGQKIKDISNKTIYTKGDYEFSTDFLAKGMYFLKVNYREKVYIYKLISTE